MPFSTLAPTWCKNTWSSPTILYVLPFLHGCSFSTNSWVWWEYLVPSLLPFKLDSQSGTPSWQPLGQVLPSAGSLDMLCCSSSCTCVQPYALVWDSNNLVFHEYRWCYFLQLEPPHLWRVCGICCLYLVWKCSWIRLLHFLMFDDHWPHLLLYLWLQVLFQGQDNKWETDESSYE